MAALAGLVWDLAARDGASPAFLRVAGAADKAAASTGKATKSMSASLAGVGKAGSVLTKRATLPLVALGAVSVDQAAKFQKSMTLIQTAGGETAAKTQAISKGIMGMAKSTGTSLDDLSEGIYTVAKAGGRKWSAADQLLVLKAAAQGAKAENVDMGTATNALTSVMMSYGASAKGAVGYQNQLIVASGRAKTTMQDFAGALSTVLPIASALHVSFAQVGGAVATLTQHGTSAREATQDLANLLRNLAGQNNVASQAMQQLGINTVDLQKNLGKRGISGTLDIVEGALAKSSKGGLVVVSAFKQAQLATKSLNTMAGTFEGTLAKQSKGLRDGNVSIKDYQAYAKSLGGQAGASALQFLALYKSSQGFSNQLKSGNSTVSTAATQLQKMLGGAEGLRTALSLGGESAGYFKKTTDEIGAAARKSGADVLGWSKTQGTLSVKLDKAKASLQVLGVEIGTALIPSLSKMVSSLSSAVSWFDHLSGTQKKVLLWSAGLVAALGPVLTLGSRLALVGRGIGTFVGGVGTRLATVAGATETTAARVGTAMRGVSSAVGGAALGVAIGTLTANASGAKQALGVLGSAAAGAATGFGSGGGALGAVVGGLAGGLSTLATQFLSAGDSAYKQIPKIQGLTQAMQDDNDAVGKNTQTLVANSLQQNGLYTAGLKLGISQRTLTLAAEGNTTALTTVQRAMASATLSAYAATAAHKPLTKAQTDASNAAGKLANGLVGVSGQLKSAKTAATNIDAGLGKLTGTAGGTVGKLNSMGQAGHDAVNGLAGTKAAASGASGTIAGMDRNAIKALGSLSNLARPHNVNVSTSQATARLNALLAKIPSGTFHFNVQADKQAQLEGRATGGGMPEGLSWVGEGGAGSRPELVQKRGSKVHVFSNQQSVGIAGRLGIKIPGFASGTANKSAIIALLRSMGATLAGAAGFAGNSQIETGGTFSTKAYNPKEGAHGFQQWEGSRWTALQALARRMGVSPTSQKAELAMIKRELSGGKYDNTLNVLRHATSARAAAAYVDAHYERSSGDARSQRMNAAAAIYKQLKSGKLAVSADPGDITTGYTKNAKGKRQKVWIFDGQQYASLRAAQNAQGRIGKTTAKQLANLRVKINGSDANALRKALLGTVADTKTAVATMLSDLDKAGGSDGALARIRKEAAGVEKQQTGLISNQTRLASMKDYQSGISGTLSGAFDLGSFGSTGDFITGAKGATGTNLAYQSELAGLRKRAGKNKQELALINALAPLGQTATLQALSKGSPGAFAQAGQAYARFTGSVASASSQAVLDKFNQTVPQLTHIVENQSRDISQLMAAIIALAEAQASGNQHAIAQALKKLAVVKNHGRR
ncbi:phage tail tape measure protein [uncultured Jatrophihabitans sp.]|uniref:phage tail tape measure protein n=1 Tax=uncultured Jatrophihabitans sp. TaxID=1610747 RepID=UPI0035CBA280